MALFNELAEKLYQTACSVSPWYAVLAVIALTNLKVLPFAWHTRLFYGILRHVAFEKRAIPKSTPEQLTLFQPSIYTSSAPLGEIDYNLHKSNATYLTDLDIARGHHVFTLFRTGFKKYGAQKGKNGNGPFFPAIGAVSCNFKREIKPYVKYEVWTRVLSWDTKWIYVVSHFVKAGAVRPQSYVDQPWKKGAKKRTAVKANEKKGAAPPSSPAIYCTCITKYVMKQGRKTVPPEEFLRACELIPDLSEAQAGTVAGVEVAEGNSVEAEILAGIQKRKKDGLAIAENFAALDGAHEWFSGEDETAFAWY